MVVATKAEIAKRKKKEEGFLKGLNPDGSMTDKKMCTQLRSSVRKVWMKHPVKLAYLYSKTYADTNPTTRTKWLIDCECCKEPTKLAGIQIDHIKGEHSLKTLEDVVPFAKSILGVTPEDIQAVCIPCHGAITYAERYGMTLEQAFEEKEIIAKCNIPVAKQKSMLIKLGYKAAAISNDEKRRDIWRIVLDKK